MTDTKDILTLAEAAAMVGRSERTLWRWAKSGKLPTLRFAGRVLVTRRAAARAAQSVRPGPRR